MPGGRPSKYQEEFPEMLVHHMQQGKSFESFAAVAYVGIRTLYLWTEKHPEFMHAKEIGEGQSLNYWEDVMKEAAFEKSYNAAIIIYSMKCRFHKWGWNMDAKGNLADDKPKEKPLTLAYSLKDGTNG